MQAIEIKNTPEKELQQAPLAGLKVALIAPGVSLKLPHARGGIVSLTVGADMRGDCTVELTNGQGWSHTLDASYASHGQRLRFDAPAGVSAIQAAKVEGDAELWLINEGPLAPVLIDPEASLEQRRERAFDRLRESCVCQFSWMGGCVLDGLLHLEQSDPKGNWSAAIDAWLGHFIRGGELVYQSPRGEEIRNKFYGVESTLPVAIIARREPQSPILDFAVANWDNLLRDGGKIVDHSVTAEGCYTIAYPMAVIAQVRNVPALADMALTQLRIRREKLCIDGDLWLRNYDGNLTFRNWTRGICWSLLGLARTLETLGADCDAGLAEFAQERAAWIIARQREDGLWDNFLDEAGQGFPPDSSGSSGIAATLLTLRKLGLVGDEALDSARRCWKGLGACLEPDGMLGSVAPNNKRGETEQHTHRRTIEPFALGLYGQLAAALRE